MRAFCHRTPSHVSLKIKDEWMFAIINCLLDVVHLIEKTQASADGCCHWLELAAQIWHYWSQQQCRTELWRGRLALFHPCGVINCQGNCFYISHGEFRLFFLSLLAFYFGSIAMVLQGRLLVSLLFLAAAEGAGCWMHNGLPA